MLRTVLAVSVLIAACKAPSHAEHARGPEAAIPRAAEPLEVTFTPPSNRTLTERSTLVRTEEPAGAAALAETISVTMTSRFEPLEGGTWALAQNIPEVKVVRGGARMEDPLVNLVTRFPLRIQLAADGAFVRFLNPQDVQTAVRKAFPKEEEAVSVLAFFTPEAIEQQARREWDGKYGGLFGKRLTPGATSYSVESFGTTAGVEIGYVLERKWMGVTPTEFGEALVFSLRCIGIPKEEAELAALAHPSLGGAKPVLEPSVDCSGQQLISRSTFVPVKSWMLLKARPRTSDGKPLTVTLERTVNAVTLE